MKKVLLSFFILLLIPVAFAVSIETSNYKIDCWPEYATLRPTNVGFEQYCLFENKQATSVDTDFAMLFDSQVRSGRAKVWSTLENVIEYTYFCNSDTYGVLDSENVYCTLPNGTLNIYTGSERAFEVLGFGAIVHYNITYSHNYWNDVTTSFNYFDASGFTEKGHAYYVEDVTWQPYEAKLVKFNYVPKHPTLPVKWDAVFGDFSAGLITLNLDPLSNPYFYTSNWVADKNESTAQTIPNDLRCGVDFYNDSYVYYPFENSTTDQSGNGRDGKKHSSAFYIDGQIDQALRLNASEAYFELGVNYNFSDDWSICTWVNAPSTNEYFIYSTNAGVNFVLSFGLNTGNTIGLWDGTNWRETNISVTPGQWEFICYNFNAATNKVDIHKNVALNETVEYNGFIDFTGNTTIGRYNQVDFDGNIDELYIFNRTLTTIELQDMYTGFSPSESCEYNSSDFEISWSRARVTYSKSLGNTNFTLRCNDNSYTTQISNTSGVFEANCSLTESNMSYTLQLNATTRFYTLTMQSTSTSSLNITFKDSETQIPITNTNVSLEITGTYETRNYVNNTGTIIIDYLELDNYTFTYDAEGFASGYVNYELTESANLVIFLDNSTSETTFNLKNQETGSAVSNAFVVMQRFYNDSWEMVGQKYSDVTGSIIFSYLDNTNYRFIITHDDYISKTFELVPTKSSYNVYLDPDVSLSDGDVVLPTVSITISPWSYVNNESNQVTGVFNIVDGEFDYYWLNVTFKDKNNYTMVVSTNGGTITENIMIEGAGFSDRVRVDYGFALDGQLEKSFTRYYSVQYSSEPLTFSSNKGNKFGLGTVELALISTFIVLIIASLAFAVSGSVGAAIMGFSSMALFSWMGWIPWYALTVIGFLSVLMIVAKFRGSVS